MSGAEHKMKRDVARASSVNPVTASLPPAGTSSPEPPGARTVSDVLRDLLRNPRHHLLAKWNWKAALLSSLLRAGIFFSTNLVAGLHAAIGAMLTELVLRSTTSGFYGAVTESMASAEPPWAASAAVMFLLPGTAHSVEFFVHWLRGTPELGLSVASSLAFTAISTAFNLFAMRRGALTVGSGSRPLQEDFGRLPHLLWSFFAAGPRALARLVWRSS